MGIYINWINMFTNGASGQCLACGRSQLLVLSFEQLIADTALALQQLTTHYGLPSVRATAKHSAPLSVHSVHGAPLKALCVLQVLAGGLESFLGYTMAELGPMWADPIRSMREEIAAHGTADDALCFDYVASKVSGTEPKVWPNGVMDPRFRFLFLLPPVSVGGVWPRALPYQPVL